MQATLDSAPASEALEMEKLTMAKQPTQEQIEQIGSALAAGRKIEAIKFYRETTGQGLKESKDFIEALIPKLKEQDPEKYAKLQTPGAGCASAIFLCIGLAAPIAWIINSLT